MLGPTPAAQALVRESAVTVLRLMFVDGEDTTVQVWPSQCSVRPVEKLLESPTAQASLEEVAVTAARKLPFANLGLEITFQLVPSQCSITESKIERPGWSPTAQTSRVEAAATPVRKLPFGSLGLAITLQLAPSQCSIKVLTE